jgi:hypothetical protein
MESASSRRRMASESSAWAKAPSIAFSVPPTYMLRRSEARFWMSSQSRVSSRRGSERIPSCLCQEGHGRGYLSRIDLRAAGVELASGLENRRWRYIRVKHRRIVGIVYRKRRQRLRTREEFLMVPEAARGYSPVQARAENLQGQWSDRRRPFTKVFVSKVTHQIIQSLYLRVFMQ